MMPSVERGLAFPVEAMNSTLLEELAISKRTPRLFTHSRATPRSISSAVSLLLQQSSVKSTRPSGCLGLHYVLDTQLFPRP